MGTLSYKHCNGIHQSLRSYGHFICILLLALSPVFLSSCGNSGSSGGSAENGSIAFSLKFPEGSSSQTKPIIHFSKAASFDCIERGIATVEAYVYDESYALLVQGGPWNCEIGEGTIQKVEEGTGRRVVVLCYNASGTLTYSGEASGITVVNGQITYAGTITVIPVGANHAPVLSTIGTQTIMAGDSLSFALEATDIDGDTLTYEIADMPEEYSVAENYFLEPETGEFYWTTTPADAGEYRALFIVHDNGTPRLSDYEVVTIRLNSSATGIPHYPVLDPIELVKNGSIVETQLAVTDPDTSIPFYFADPVDGKSDNYPGPDTFSFYSETGAFSWETASATPGNYYFLFGMDDGTGLTDSEEVTITVGNVNRPPVLTPIGRRLVYMHTAITFGVSAVDPEGDSLTFTYDEPVFNSQTESYYEYPTGITFDPVTQTFTWDTSDVNFEDEFALRIRVTDDGSHQESDFEDVVIFVLAGF